MFWKVITFISDAKSINWKVIIPLHVTIWPSFQAPSHGSELSKLPDKTILFRFKTKILNRKLFRSANNLNKHWVQRTTLIVRTRCQFSGSSNHPLRPKSFSICPKHVSILHELFINRFVWSPGNFFIGNVLVFSITISIGSIRNYYRFTYLWNKQ